MGCGFIGIEFNPNYVEIAQRRIERTTSPNREVESESEAQGIASQGVR